MLRAIEAITEALEIEEGIPAVGTSFALREASKGLPAVPIQGFGYLTGARIGLKPVIRYPVKYAQGSHKAKFIWADSFNELGFDQTDLNLLMGMHPNRL